MIALRYLTGLVVGLSLLGCKKGDEGADGAKSSPAQAPASNPAVQPANAQQDSAGEGQVDTGIGDVGPVEKVAAAVGLADGLPDLKPVLKTPFPDGATEEQICEAIENTEEKDLWERFGHLVPMHIFGTILIVEAKGQSPQSIHELIRDQHYGFDARVRFCKDSMAMVYIRGLPDEYENHGHVEGRKPLVQQLDSGSQVKVRESFAFQGDQERLSDYCRADADLCEELVKLDRANEGLGLCHQAGIRINIAEDHPRYPQFLRKCRSQERAALVCALVEREGQPGRTCENNLRNLLSFD